MYIYREREREKEQKQMIYIYIYICIYMGSGGRAAMWPGTKLEVLQDAHIVMEMSTTRSSTRFKEPPQGAQMEARLTFCLQ